MNEKNIPPPSFRDPMKFGILNWHQQTAFTPAILRHRFKQKGRMLHGDDQKNTHRTFDACNAC